MQHPEPHRAGTAVTFIVVGTAERNPAVVINDHVHILPPRAARILLPSDRYPVPGPEKAVQLLDIQVQQVARLRVFW